MLSNYRFERANSDCEMLDKYERAGFCIDNHDFLLYRYIQSGEVKKARSELAFIRRKRYPALTSAQVQELICAAVHSGEIAVIKMILEEGIGIIKQSPNDELLMCLLWIAVLCDFKDAVELLVSSGANVNVLLGYHPLMFYEKELTILHVLLRRDSSPSNEELIKLVTEHGANLQARDYDGQTALFYAARMGRVREAKLLLKKEADPNVADNAGVTPLLAAAQSVKANDLLPLLIMHGADVAARDVDGRNALHWLNYAPAEHADLARALIEMGVSISQKESLYHYQPLHLAAANGKKEMVKVLLDYGANPNAPAGDGVFPLYLAAARSDMSSALKMLLERGADIGLTTITGRTALHSACENFQLQNIENLISFAADVLAEDQGGNTPFALIGYKNVNPCSRLMMRKLALVKACNPWAQLKDESLMREYSKMWNYYQDCTQNIYKMVFARLTSNCTFFDLLTGNSWEIAKIMLDHKFEINFRQYDLTEFSMYTEDILQAFEQVENCYHVMLQQDEMIISEE